MKKQLINPVFIIFTAVIVLASSLMPGVAVLAQKGTGVTKEEFRRESDITFFGKDPVSCSAAGISGDITKLVGSDNVEMAWNFFIQKGLSPEQAAGVMGNLLVESHMQPDNQEDTKPFPQGGWGIAQWTNSKNAKPGEGRRDKLVQAVQSAGLPYTNQQTPPDQVIPLLTFELNYLYKESVGRKSRTDPGAANEWEGLRNVRGSGPQAVEAAMIYWEKNFERAGKPVLGERLRAATAVYDEYRDNTVPGAITASSASTASCGGAGGIVGGNVAQTAIGLAWPQPFSKKLASQTNRTSPLTPSPAYADALRQFNSGQRSDGADCGVFISTVLRASGVDPEFPPISTGAQYDYMKAHPEKYLNVGTTTTTEKLQPGDILNIPNHSSPTGVGHTFIWLGPQPGGYTTASASLNSRSANLSNDDIIDSRGTYTIFRPITNTAGSITP